jgi:predicted transcriptional regulator
MNYSITNNTKRIVGLQKVVLLLGVFGGPVQPGESIVVPSDYMKAMEGEKSFSASVKSKDLTVSDTDAPAVPVSKAPPPEAKAAPHGPVFESAKAKIMSEVAERLEEMERKLYTSFNAIAQAVKADLSARDAQIAELETKLAEFEKLEAATKPKK